MIKQLLAAVFYFIAILPAEAAWDGAAVQALPYLYHEQELKADITAMDAQLRQISLQRLHMYYLAEVNRQPYVVQSFPQPLVYDDLYGDYVTLYQSIENDFLRRVEADKDGLLSRLERDERQDYQNSIPSPEMVQLKEFYLKFPAFFDLPLSFSNYKRYAVDVEAEPKYDLAQRLPLAQQLAEFLRLHEADYVVDGDVMRAVSPDIVEKNLIASLTNNFTVAQLSAMVEQAQSDAGQNFLRMKDHAFKNRFISLQEMYRVELAAAADIMPAKISALPQLVYPSILQYRHRHHKKHKSENQ